MNNDLLDNYPQQLATECVRLPWMDPNCNGKVLYRLRSGYLIPSFALGAMTLRIGWYCQIDISYEES
jgi:hypothetical protein